MKSSPGTGAGESERASRLWVRGRREQILWMAQRLGEAESRDSGEVSLLSQVPTPITEMEISVKRVRAAAVAAKSSFL